MSAAVHTVFHSAPRRLGAAFVCLVSVLSVSACSVVNPSGDAQSPASRTSAEYKKAQQEQHAAEVGDEDLHDVKCTVDSTGAWTFTGTLKNKSRYTSHYSVSVTVANRDNGAVFGTASHLFAVKAGEDEQVHFKTMASSGGADTRRVVCEDFVTVVRDS